MSGTPPFPPNQSRRPGLLDRFLGRRRVESAAAELQSLLAASADPRAVSRTDVDRICEHYRVRLDVELVPAATASYRSFLLFCLADRQLSEDELANLAHLRHLLDLDGRNVARIHSHVARLVYSRSVDEVLADGTVDPDERAFLARLRERLEIPPDLADNILEVKTRQRDAREARHQHPRRLD